MNKLAIVLLNLSTLLITAPLFSMHQGKKLQGKSWADSADDAGSSRPTSYSNAVTPTQNRGVSASSQDYRSSRTVVPDSQRKLWNPKNPQLLQAAQTQEAKTTPLVQSPQQIIKKDPQPARQLSEPAQSAIGEQASQIDDKALLARLALLGDMLPGVLKRQVQQEATIAELKKELTTQAQTYADQRSALESEHQKALQALHTEFNAQMLSKQEELSKRIVESTEKNTSLQVEHAKVLSDIFQHLGTQNYQLYMIACHMGLVQQAPHKEAMPEQKEPENT